MGTPHLSKQRILYRWSHLCPAGAQHYDFDLFHDITIYIMPLAFKDRVSDDIIGLVLLPTTGRRGQYRRIGIFETHASSIFPKIKEASRNLEKDLYEELDDRYGHTIEII
jgi:hypothetical protein